MRMYSYVVGTPNPDIRLEVLVYMAPFKFSGCKTVLLTFYAVGVKDEQGKHDIEEEQKRCHCGRCASPCIYYLNLSGKNLQISGTLHEHTKWQLVGRTTFEAEIPYELIRRNEGQGSRCELKFHSTGVSTQTDAFEGSFTLQQEGNSMVGGPYHFDSQVNRNEEHVLSSNHEKAEANLTEELYKEGGIVVPGGSTLNRLNLQSDVGSQSVRRSRSMQPSTNVPGRVAVRRSQSASASESTHLVSGFRSKNTELSQREVMSSSSSYSRRSVEEVFETSSTVVQSANQTSDEPQPKQRQIMSGKEVEQPRPHEIYLSDAFLQGVAKKK